MRLPIGRTVTCQVCARHVQCPCVVLVSHSRPTSRASAPGLRIAARRMATLHARIMTSPHVLCGVGSSSSPRGRVPSGRVPSNPSSSRAALVPEHPEHAGTPRATQQLLAGGKRSLRMHAMGAEPRPLPALCHGSGSRIETPNGTQATPGSGFRV